MCVGNTAREIFGQLPDEEILRGQNIDKSAAYTNLHVHLPPNFGSIVSIEQVIARAREEKIAVLGASNYYDHSIYTSFAHAALKSGIVPVFGIEVLTMDETLRAAGILTNEPKNPGKLYLCGKGLTCFDRIDDESLAIRTKIRKGDMQRIEEMIEKINAIDLLQDQGIHLDYHEIARRIAGGKQVPVDTVFLQERHLAQTLQQVVFAKVAAADREAFLRQLYQIEGAVETDDVVAIQNDLRTCLLKQGRVAYVDECFVSPEEAARLILGLGGYVSYPVLADGAPSISAFEGPPNVLAENLLNRQIAAAEFISVRNTPEILTKFVKTLRAWGIVIGNGTEHNNPSWLPLQPHCIQNAPLTDELVPIFWEGACVAVAHQYLTAKGKEGFRFLPDMAFRKALIVEMAELGAYVVSALKKLNS